MRFERYSPLRASLEEMEGVGSKGHVSIAAEAEHACYRY